VARLGGGQQRNCPIAGRGLHSVQEVSDFIVSDTKRDADRFTFV